MHVLILGFGIAGRTHAEAWREVEGVGKITTLDCRANAGADMLVSQVGCKIPWSPGGG